MGSYKACNEGPFSRRFIMWSNMAHAAAKRVRGEIGRSRRPALLVPWAAVGAGGITVLPDDGPVNNRDPTASII